MKKLKIWAAVIIVILVAYGSFQVCFADSFDVDIVGSGDNAKIVLTINGKKYELKLNPFSENNSVEDKSNSSTAADGQSNSSAANSQNITLDKAKEIALADAGLTDAVFTKTKTDYDDGRTVYEIDFISNSTEYEYEIDATTGNIISKDIDYNYNKGNNTANNSTNNSSTNNSNNTTVYNITSDEAENIALSDAGISRDSVKYINSHIDKDDGVFLYEVEFVVNNTEYDYEINADTGVIISKDVERH